MSEVPGETKGPTNRIGRLWAVCVRAIGWPLHDRVRTPDDGSSALDLDDGGQIREALEHCRPVELAQVRRREVGSPNQRPAIGVALADDVIEQQETRIVNVGPTRTQAWRRQHMDRYHADAQGDFLRSEAGILWVYVVVLILWPWLLVRSQRSTSM